MVLSGAEIYHNRHPKFLFSQAEANAESNYLKTRYPPECKPSKPSPNWKVIVVEALGSKCAHCGSTEGLHIDHIIPLSKKGEHKLQNLQLLCKPCHAEKTRLDGYPSLAKVMRKH